MARSTVFQYKGKEVDPRKVGHDLGVRAVLMGRLIQQGDNLTIRTELVKSWPAQRKIIHERLIGERAIERLGGREQYANIQDPNTAPNILNHPKSLMS